MPAALSIGLWETAMFMGLCTGEALKEASGATRLDLYSVRGLIAYLVPIILCSCPICCIAELDLAKEMSVGGGLISNVTSYGCVQSLVRLRLLPAYLCCFDILGLVPPSPSLDASSSFFDTTGMNLYMQGHAKTCKDMQGRSPDRLVALVRIGIGLGFDRYFR